MLLGKKYTRIKRKINAATINYVLTKPDGTDIKFPRKLKMLTVLAFYGCANGKASIKEALKFKNAHNL